MSNVSWTKREDTLPSIRISSVQEFERLLDSVADDCVTALIHWKLWRDLDLAISHFEREMNQSPAFWSRTLRAHLDVVFFRLARLYDQHSKSLSLRNWLETIQANIAFFDVDNFKTRLKDNPFVESLADDVRRPDQTVLAQDIKSVSKTADLLVTRLYKARNQLFAHRDPLVVLVPIHLRDFEMTCDDIDTLIDRAVQLVNNYSSLFRATTYSTIILGRDDFERTLRLVKKALSAEDVEYEQEIKRVEELAEGGSSS
jgi:AbiU2